MTQLFIFSCLVSLLCILGLGGSLMLNRSSRMVAERVNDIVKVRSAGIPLGTQGSNTKKKLFEMVRVVRSRLGLREDEKLLDRFAGAGFVTAASRDVYFTTRLLGPVLALLLGFLIPSNRFLWMMILVGLFYLGPDIILSRLAKRRREKIRRGVPDAIDLLVICVDAGLGMDQAMLRVAQELGTTHPQLYEEFMQINREQRAGKLRLEAWQSMAKRTQVPEIDGFVNMLMQNERFGTPIARALSSYGDLIRLKRRQHAEELAAKTTVKIIFPLVLFIFPSMFIVLLGPAGIAISRGLGDMPH